MATAFSNMVCFHLGKVAGMFPFSCTHTDVHSLIVLSVHSQRGQRSRELNWMYG